MGSESGTNGALAVSKAAVEHGTGAFWAIWLVRSAYGAFATGSNCNIVGRIVHNTTG